MSAKPGTASAAGSPLDLAAPHVAVGRVALFSAASFLSAALLFSVQPMVAKMVLPLLGGTPAVWNTCMLFFQAALLGGYAYAHAAPRRLGLERHARLHVLLFLAAVPLLPLAVGRGDAPPGEVNPIPWLLGVLVAGVGLPFFLLSTNAPLLQRWLAAAPHGSGRDPYFLYATSNLGSLVALLAYPLLLEPSLRLEEQSRAWGWGFGLLILLLGACAWTVRPARGGLTLAPAARNAVPRTRAARWVALAFVPSSLLLGVTTHLTTDVAAVPLLWIVPLALYLLSFVVAFAGPPEFVREEGRVWLPVLVLLLSWAILAEVTVAVPLLLPLNLLAFFWAALLCHAELALDRPAPEHLTAFYLWISVGGVLGGLFNAVLAPALFDTVLEYPVVLALSVVALPAVGRRAGPGRGDAAFSLAVAVLTAALVVLVLPAAEARHGVTGRLAVVAAPLVACFAAVRRPWRFGPAVAATVIAATLASASRPEHLLRERDFFGVVTVEHDRRSGARRLYHGNILHGEQRRDRPRAATLYYHADGPVGELLERLGRRVSDLGVIGLGAGALAAYGSAGQRIVFYEISPVVVRVARDPRLFTYLRDSPADVEVVLGDARVRLTEAEPGAYDVLVVDAFSSDAIPVHLITREAFELYVAKLAPDGLLAVHVSNRYLDLEPVVAAIAREGGWAARVRRDVTPATPERQPSVWIVLARSPADLHVVEGDPRWVPLRDSAAVEVWTDDFSNLIRVFRFGNEPASPEPAGNSGAAPQAASRTPARGGRS